MHVEKILSAARERLVTEDAALIEAAKRVGGPNANLLVFCGGQGTMRRVEARSAR